MSWSDDKLSAYLDGELNPEEMEQVARDMAADKVLAARIDRLAAANQMFVAAAADIDAVALPGRTQALLTETAKGARVIAFQPRRIGAFVMEHRAIAASLVCAVAVWGVFSSVVPAVDPSPDGGGYILASSPLHRVLEESPSSVAVELAPGISATPRLSFATAAGDVCRQYRVDSRAGRSDAIACRGDRRWRVELAVFGSPGSGAGDYQTASGSASEVLDRFIDGAIVGAPFDAAEEARRIDQDWRER